jgi:hypothetical protein
MTQALYANMNNKIKKKKHGQEAGLPRQAGVSGHPESASLCTSDRGTHLW